MKHTRKLSIRQAQKVRDALRQHKRLVSSFFWRSPTTASARRQMEKQESWEVSFTHQGVHYAYSCDVSCSARNVYYAGRFTVNGEKKTRAAFSALQKHYPADFDGPRF